MGLDQSNRYADLSLEEDELIAGGKHILVAYKMKPKAGYGYLGSSSFCCRIIYRYQCRGMYDR